MPSKNIKFVYDRLGKTAEIRVNAGSVEVCGINNVGKRTSGRALVARPLAPVKHGEMSTRIGQCHNVFIFSGIRLGTLAPGAKEVPPFFFISAAKSVSELLSEDDLKAGVLLPPVGELKEISNRVALEVGLAAIRVGESGLCAFTRFNPHNEPERLKILIKERRWEARYPALGPV